MMFNLRRKKSGAFSLIELLVAITIMLLLVGIAAWFLDDYLYKSKVAKASQDLDMFAGAVRLYDSLENTPFSAYNYSTALIGSAGNKYFSFYPLAMNVYAAVWGTLGGATTQWTDFSQNSLTSLIGTYLKTVPPDPWGSPYLINTSSGVISSMGSDLLTCYGGNSFGITETGRTRDIVNYYLGDKLTLATVYVWDNNNNGTIEYGEYMDFTFNKDIQHPTTGIPVATAFEFSSDNVTWASFGASGVATGAPAAGFYLSAVANQAVVRLRNNPRVLRYTFTNGIPMNSIVGYAARVTTRSATTSDGLSAFIADTDQYCKQLTLVPFRGGYGRPFQAAFNPPVEIKVRTF